MRRGHVNTTVQGRVRRGRRAVSILLTGILVFLGVVSASAGAAIISGTATLPDGKPLAYGAVEIKDSLGGSKTVHTNAAGAYWANVSALTPPFMIAAGPEPLTAGNVLFSTASMAGTANLDAYSDLVLNMIYKAQGQTAADQFFIETVPAIPAVAQLNLIGGFVRTSILRWLHGRVAYPQRFNFFKTPFLANGLGFDKVLRKTTILSTDEEIAVTFGAVTQDSNFTADSGTGTVSVSTTTTAGSVSSSSISSTIVPDTAAAAEIAGINTLLLHFTQIVNGKGAALTASELLPLFDPNYLDQGEDLEFGTADIATSFRGVTLSGFGVTNLNAISTFDGSHELVDVVLSVVETIGTQSASSSEPMTFKCDSLNNCVFFGDQQIVKTQRAVQVEERTDSNISGNSGPAPDINVQAAAPIGTVTSMTISDAGNNFFNNQSLVKDQNGTQTKKFKPTPTTTLLYVEDQFFTGIYPLNIAPPAPGTLFTFDVTPASGSPVNYTVETTGVTGEGIDLIHPLLTGAHTLADAHLGSPLTVAWGLPLTYTVGQIGVSGFVSDCSTQLDVSADQKIIPTTATTATITFPAEMPHHAAVKLATLNLKIDGVNGESAIVLYDFGSCP